MLSSRSTILLLLGVAAILTIFVLCEPFVSDVVYRTPVALHTFLVTPWIDRQAQKRITFHDMSQGGRAIVMTAAPANFSLLSGARTHNYDAHLDHDKQKKTITLRPFDAPSEILASYSLIPDVNGALHGTLFGHPSVLLSPSAIARLSLLPL